MNYFIIIIISIILSAFFSGMEIAFVSSNKLRLELDKKQNRLTAKILSVFTNNPGQYISTMLIGNNIALVVYGIIMARVLETPLSDYIPNNAGLLLAQTVISTLIILIFAEFLPKTLFRINPNRTIKLFYLPLYGFFLMFYPLSYLTILLSNFILKKILKVGIAGLSNQYNFGKVDLGNLIDLGLGMKEESLEHENEIKYFQNVLEFSQTKLRECMIPRNEIVSLEINSAIPEMKDKFIDSGHSKLMIYQNSIDNIVGYVNSKELFRNPKSIKDILMKCPFVPETMTANKLMDLFMNGKKNLAVVVDEFGGTSGIVTLEDIIEEIFGEIEDEHDVQEFTEEQVSENEFVFSGRLEIDYLNENYFVGIPENEEYDTLAGFILYHHQSLPEKMEEIVIDNFQFIVLEVSETKLDLVKLVKLG